MCITSIRICFTITRKTGSSPFSPPHASLFPSYWVPGLFAWYDLHAYGPLSQHIRRKISLMWPMDDASISNGLRRKQGFLLVIAMMEMNERCWLRLGSSTFWATEDGKSSGWQGWCFPPEIYYDLGPTLRRPTLGHLFWHSHIVMTIILRRSLTLQTRNCEIRYFWPWPCKYFCAASGQLEIPFCTVPLYSMIPVLDCYYIVPSRFCDRYLMEFWFVTAMRYLFLQSSLAWTHRLVGHKVSCSIIPSSGRLNQIDIHVSCIFEGRMSRKCILKG